MVWLTDRIRIFVYCTISLSSLCKLIWRHWTYKMPVRYIFSSVWVRLSIPPPLSIAQYMGLCVFSLPLVMIEIIYILSYYHHQIGSMNYYPLFRVGSWNNSMCCMSLYILIYTLYMYIQRGQGEKFRCVQKSIFENSWPHNDLQAWTCSLKMNINSDVIHSKQKALRLQGSRSALDGVS